MDYKEKYSEALERAKALYENANGMILKKWVEQVFPELKESKDEKTRKEIIKTVELYGPKTGNPKVYNDMISWLEKQGEPSDKTHYWTEEEIEPIISDYLRGAEHYGGMIGRLRCLKPKSLEKQGEKILANSEKTCKDEKDTFDYEHADIQQKDFAPKVEPKFKVGDIIIKSQNSDINKFGKFKITGIKDGRYWYSEFVICEISEQDEWELARIEPKFKIGDWVVFNNKHQSIYQVEKIEDGYYILRHTYGGTFRVCVLHDESLRLWTIEDAKDGDVLACNKEILLFKSYSVQGRISLYCWYNGQTNNFHDKEVVDTLLTTRNKICPATKEQRNLLFQKMKDAGYEWDANKKELKKIEQKLAWSEEDEKMKDAIYSCVDLHYDGLAKTSLLIWLKSLKERYTWKPSDEQMKALANACDGKVLLLDYLNSLYQDLKTLREE